MDFYLCVKRLLALFTIILLFSCIVSLEEIFAQTEINESAGYKRYLTLTAGTGDLTDFSKKKTEFDNHEIGYPAFESGCKVFGINAEHKGVKYDQSLQFFTFYSGKVKFSEGLTEDRNVNENSSSYIHFSFSYSLRRKFEDRLGIRYYAGILGKTLFENRKIEYLSIGSMKTRDFYVLLGGRLSVESPVKFKTRINVSMDNYFAVPLLNITKYEIPGYGKSYSQRLIETDFCAGIEYEILKNKWLRFNIVREEYRSLSISDNISVPRKDCKRIICLLSYKQPIEF
jgi:hypothetical protein